MKKTIRIFIAAMLIACVMPFAYTSANADWFPDDTFATETMPESGLYNPPISIAEVTSADTLESFKNDDLPVQAILSLDENGKVVGENGEEICDLSVALDEYLQKKILPVFRVTETSADAFLTRMKTDRRITDASVTSSSPEAVKKIKSVYPFLRGIIEFDENADVKRAAYIANAAYAQICVLPESTATYDNVRYIQARFKTVWVKADESDRFSIKNCIASGCFGVISENYPLVNSVLGEYAEGISRTPYDVAHRGLPESYNENSVSGTVAAVKAGATHVELDCYLTLDNEIAFMHDAGLARTSTGSGNIEDYTSAQLENFRLNQFSDEKIPLIEDIAQALQGSDVVLVLEIKTKKTAVAEVLAEKLNGKDLADLKSRLTIISFDRNQLAKIKEVLPEIPTADLGGSSSDDLTTILTRSGEYNCAVDYNYGAIDKTKYKRLIARGFIPWTWTYGGEVTVITGLETGNPAMTNNNADALTSIPQKAEVMPTQSSKPEVGKTIKLKVTEYSGKQKTVNGRATDVKDLGNGKYLVLADYEPTEYYLSAIFHTQSAVVTVASKNKGCSSSVGLYPLALIALFTTLLFASERKFIK